MPAIRRLIKFWADYEPEAQDKFHSRDRERVYESNLRLEEYENYRQFIDRLPGEHHPQAVQTHAIPQPFLGNIRKSKVTFVLMNPGFSALSFYELQNQNFLNRVLDNIHNQPHPYPFMYIDPDYVWTGGYKWWSQRLDPYIEADRHPSTYADKARRVANLVSAIEIFPYSSRSRPAAIQPQLLQTIPSCGRAIEAIEQLVVEAKKGKRLVVFKRNVAGLLGIQESSNVLICRSTQGFQIGLKSHIGHRLRQALIQQE